MRGTGKNGPTLTILIWVGRCGGSRPGNRRWDRAKAEVASSLGHVILELELPGTLVPRRKYRATSSKSEQHVWTVRGIHV